MKDQTNLPLVLLLWGAGLGAAAQYAKVSVVFDRLPLHYPDAGASLGFVVSSVGIVGILLGVVAGLLAQRFGYRWTLLWALWLGAGVSALEATLPPLPLMLGLRIAEGVSHLAIVVVAPTLIAELSAPRHSGWTLSLWSTFFGVAFAGLVTFGVPFADDYGVGGLFLVHALWMAGIALILAVTLPSFGGGQSAMSLSVRKIFDEHRWIYSSPFVSAPAIGWFFYTFCYLGLLTLLPRYIPEDRVVVILALMPLVSIATSMTLGVWLIAHLNAVRVVILGMATTVACLVWLWIVPGSPVACLVWAAMVGLVQGASFAAVPELNAGLAERAQANGAMAQMGNLGNALGTPGLLIAISIAGYAGMIGVTIAFFVVGIAMHVFFQRVREKSASG